MNGLWRLVVLMMLASLPAYAGGPLLVGGPFDAPGVAFKWDTSAPIPFRTDLGTLGTLDKAAADQLTDDLFLVWENVPTATISFTKAGNLAQDVTGANFLALDSNLNSDINTSNAIIYDTDGSVTDEVFGSGASDDVLGFAGPQTIASDGTSNFYTLARAVLNGKFIDGQPSPEVALAKFQEAFIHELGHFSGLDHSQINLEALNLGQRTADNLAGLPTMFPFLLGSAAPRLTLAPDDVAAISELYPTAGFQGSTGRIQGRIFFSDGATPVQALNVIARQVDDPLTPEDESRRIAVSSVSGFLFTASAGNSLIANSADFFGSRDQTLIGFYEIPGLASGSYTVEVEAIDPEFIDASGLNPLGFMGFQFPMPGTCVLEFLNQAPPESDTDACGDKTPLVVTPGTVLNTGTDIILNGTQPTFDAWESARLWLPNGPHGNQGGAARESLVATGLAA